MSSNPLISSSTSTSTSTPSSSSATHGHGRNASTYISAEAGRPSSSSASASATGSTSNLEQPRNLTQRSPTPSPTKATFGFNDDHIPPAHQAYNNSNSHSNGPISLEKSLSTTASASLHAPQGWTGVTPQRVGKAIGARFMRAVRRGNLPFLLVFFSCTIVFFSALAGVGYHEPTIDSTTPSTPGAAQPANPEFRVGGPVFDDHKGLERRIAEQRALEESWARKRRPKDGAWMRKQRDDKAIRRKGNTNANTATIAQSQETDQARMVKRDLSGGTA
ncbi:uncharacterized protein I303_107759 [Kwoniella dejecticola CBS 10117]|uniref:Uncharacterized protein n=1 Tax=Kwoniella dejecticola CBS 10117 TaxID=1296121 RepID=A0AAJ8KWH6_9TREE